MSDFSLKTLQTESYAFEESGTYPLVISLKKPEWDVVFAAELERLLEPSYFHPDVIIDMSKVRFIDSTCLGKLVKMRKERRTRGFAAERIVLPNENIRRVFALVRFDEIWPLYRNLTEAIAAETS